MNIFQDLIQKVLIIFASVVVGVTGIFTGQKPIPTVSPTPSPSVIEVASPTPTDKPLSKITSKPTSTPIPTRAARKLQVLDQPTPTTLNVDLSSSPKPTQTPNNDTQASNSNSSPQTPKNIMPDKPIVESFCDNKGNCVHSQFADPSSNSSLTPYPTVRVGETLSFTIKVSGQESDGTLAFIIDQGYDWLKEGGKKPWSSNLTYTKTFSDKDVSASGYPIYAYIKSQNDNYHRRSNGCNWIDYSCDDSATLIYTVIP